MESIGGLLLRRVLSGQSIEDHNGFYISYILSDRCHFTPKDLEMGETWFAVEVSKLHACVNVFIKEVSFFL